MEVTEANLYENKNTQNALEDFLTFDYSYGYDCKRLYNLIILDKVTLLFASGNFLHFFNVNNRKLNFQRSKFGNGIGCITKNPNNEYTHFAVGENGEKPTIVIHEWPSLQVVNLIPNGAKANFLSLTYSPCGKMLVSHSGEPDYTLTIFDWSTATILFQSLLNAPIHKILFSSYKDNHFTTFGTDYIKFWKISKTFTGLRLKEQEGRFDQTPLSNIMCTYAMPDETVLSGCEWGNILVWENGYIKVEIERKMNKKCHDAPITQFLYKDNELWSISMEGQIKLWYYKKIDLMKIPDDHALVSVEPIYEFSIPEIMFFGIHKEGDDNVYFAQDGNGGLWQIDLNTKADVEVPIQLYKCHGGAVVDIEVCPWKDYLFSLGVDGRLQIYEYQEREFLYSHQFPAKGCCFLWLPVNVQPSGNMLIMGFDDGNLRAVVVDVDNEIRCTTVQVIKSHGLPIRNITLNERTKILASSSEDRTIFVYHLQCSETGYAAMVPIGYVVLPEIVNSLTWSTSNINTILVGASNGYYATIDLPTDPQHYTEHTFLLQQQACRHALKYKDKDLTNNILWILIVEEETWFSMDNSNSGLIYKFSEKDKKDYGYNCHIIYSFDGILINNCRLSHGKAFLAMGDGSVIITNQSNFSMNHRFPLHDNQNSFISKMCFSRDHKYFFSCGHDGNIFSHKVNVDPEHLQSPIRSKVQSPVKVEDRNGYANLSIEEIKTRKEADEQLKLAEIRKKALTQRLTELKKSFQIAMKRNKALPERQRLTREELEMHPLITEYFDKELKEQLELVKAQLAHEVEKSKIILQKSKKHFTDPLDFFPISVRGIRENVAVTIINQKKLSPNFHETLREVEEKMQEKDLLEQLGEGIEIPKQVPTIPNTAVPKRSNRKRDVLFSLSMQELKYGRKINQLLNRYRARKLKLQKRKKEWEAFKTLKPLKVNSEEDQNELKSATKNIGDFKLKSNPNYKVPKSSQLTVIKKYHQILLCRLRKYNKIHEYNKKIYKIRIKRVEAIKSLQNLYNELQVIHEELSEENKRFGPNILLTEDEFLEKNLKVVVILSEEKSPTVKEETVQVPKKDLLEKEVLIEDDAEDATEWENEARNYRKHRKIFQQSLVLKKIEKEITAFDREISDLAKEGNEVMRDVDLLDLHIITLNQELIILNQFEAAEDDISEKIRDKIKKLKENQNKITNNQSEIKSDLEKVQNLRKEGNSLQKRFLDLIKDNSHYHYLKSVFKGQETEMFSSSESSIEAENSESLDECDQTLYEMTLGFQKQRTFIHDQMKDLKNEVDGLNNDIKHLYGRAKKLEREVKLLRDNFDKLQTKKQNKLNEVICTIILKLNQLQCLNSNGKPSIIGDTLIFSQSTLTNLYKKVGQIHIETELQKTKQKTYTTHMCRMQTDCHLMKEKIKKLENQIEESIKKKIGVVVNVDVIEEARLKQKLFEFKLSQTNVKSAYDQQLRKLNELLQMKQMELKETIKDNTSKMNVLTALHKEKTELLQILDKQCDKRRHVERVAVVAEACKENIEKLSDIIKKQNQEIEVLQNEIKRLSYKTLPSSSAKMTDELLSIHLDSDSARRDSFKLRLWDFKEESITKKEDSPIVQPLHATEVQIPSVLSDEIEEMVQQAVVEMLESLRNISKISKIETKHIVQQIIPSIMEQNKVDDIVRDLKTFLPKDFTTEQYGAVEDAAKKILVLLHPELNLKSIEDSATELMVEIIEEMSQSDEKLNIVIEKLLVRLVQCLPLKFLNQEATVKLFISKIEDLLEENEEAILDAVSSVSNKSSTDIQEFAKKIIDYIRENSAI